MKRRSRIQACRAVGTLLILLAFSACAPTSTDLLRPRGTSGLNAEGNRPDIRRIQFAIRDGAARAGWAITKEEPGAIYANVQSGGHDATVRIQYDVDGWEIQRESSSSGLKYNPDYWGREIIHFRYNKWVRGLNGSIQNSLREQQWRAIPATGNEHGS
jgi:hypothetical protein